MATITVSKQPSALTAAENPIVVEFATAASGTTESYALTTIKVNAGVTADVDWVQIVMNQPVLKGVRFNASASPAGPTDFLSSGYTFIFSTITFTPEEIAASLGEAIRTDPNISTYYSTYVSGDTIYINAKLANQRLALATGTTVTGGNNIITASSYSRFTITTVSQGSTTNQGDLESRYAIWADLFLDNSPTLTPFGTDKPLSSMQFINTYKKNWIYGDNSVDFDLSTVLKSYCEPAPVPTGTTGLEGPFTGYIRNYKVQYGDYKAVGFQNIAITLSGFPNMIKVGKGTINGKWVTAASLPYGSTNTLFEYYSGGTIGTGKALSYSPAAKKVFIAQKKEYIYFLNSLYARGTSSFNFRVSIDYEFIDNSSDSITLTAFNETITGSTTNTKDGLYRINVSPSEVGIDTNGQVDGKTVRAYTISLRADAIETLIDPKRYVIDEVQPSTGMEVIWMNEFGCHDTFYFGGNVTVSVERDQEEQVKNVPYDFPEGYERNSVYDTTVYNKYQLSSSYVDESTFNWLKGLLKSNKVYYYDTTTSKVKYVTLTDFDYEKDTVRNQYVVSVTLQDTLYENNVGT